MILLYGKNSVGNVIHAVIGPESELWHSLHGSLAIDVTPLLKICNETYPVLLNISRCDSEAELIVQLQEAAAAGAEYPFLPGTAVFAPTKLLSADANGNNMQELDSDKPQPDVIKEDTVKSKRKSKTVDILKGKCSRCPDEHAELVPDLMPAICFNCARIDLYQARRDKPFGNPDKFSANGD